MEEYQIPLPPATDTPPKTNIYNTTTEISASLSPPSPSPQHLSSTISSPPPTTMTQLLGQASEVLHHVFLHVDPTDLASLSKTCRHLNTVIKNDELLWKLHYLARFDRPQETDEYQLWRSRLCKLINVQKLLESEDEEVKTKNLEEVLIQTLHLTNHATSSSTKNIDFLSSLYNRGININQFLCKSSLFPRAQPQQWSSAATESLRQISAQLHVYAGMNIDAPWPEPESPTSCLHTRDERNAYGETSDGEDDTSDEETEPARFHLSEESRAQLRDYPRPIHDAHPWARSRVYDLRRYKTSNMWGPFTDDGTSRIDWEKVQAIMIDLAYNHRRYSQRRTTMRPDPMSLWSATRRTAAEGWGKELLVPWQSPFDGIAPNSYVSAYLEGKVKNSPHPELDALDPYGVRGSWSRIVCFLDYNDLYRFNFERRAAHLPAEQERGPISTREAFRLIKLHLHVTEVEEVEGVDDQGNSMLPIVHFQGTSRSTFMAWDPNANSGIRGTVRRLANGTIRWTSFSIFHGEERWRSEGVQIGGLKSARGILGNWFDKEFGDHGPAGPTAFWKVSDTIVEEDERAGPGVMQIFLAE